MQSFLISWRLRAQDLACQETREATASLRKSVEQQHLVSSRASAVSILQPKLTAALQGPEVRHPRQRLYQMAAADFQRKLDEACKRRSLGCGLGLGPGSSLFPLLCRKVTTSRMELASEPGGPDAAVWYGRAGALVGCDRKGFFLVPEILP